MEMFDAWFSTIIKNYHVVTKREIEHFQYDNAQIYISRLIIVEYHAVNPKHGFHKPNAGHVLFKTFLSCHMYY